jgi:8-oxo-dGTP pyrophosphatase MutT (NUDIX family)
MSSTAAGVFFYSKSTDRYLYLLRSDSRNPTWSIPGGKIEDNETLLDGIQRECSEEIGFFDFENDLKLIPIQKFVNNTFTYHTFFCQVEKEFIPQLNNEHCGYAWVGDNLYPKPLHSGLFSTVIIDVVQEKLKILTKK